MLCLEEDVNLMKAIDVPDSNILYCIFNIEYAVITGPTHFHFINRDSYRNRVDTAMKTKSVILDLRRLVYIDCSAIMTLQVGMVNLLHHFRNWTINTTKRNSSSLFWPLLIS